jgi:hypothetical protein
VVRIANLFPITVLQYVGYKCRTCNAALLACPAEKADTKHAVGVRLFHLSVKRLLESAEPCREHLVHDHTF